MLSSRLKNLKADHLKNYHSNVKKKFLKKEF